MLPEQFVMDTYRKQVNVHGKLLSQADFMRQTRISAYHWEGGYWRSWSEFQAALGFTPNKRKTKTPDGVLLRRYAELALELKRLPRYTDMKVRRRQDPSFPCDATYYLFGGHARFMLKLEAFCEGKPEFAPVAAMLDERRSQYIARQRNGTRGVRGFVYLCRAGEPQLRTYRLGHERGGYKRVRRLAQRMRVLPDTIHVIDTDDPQGIESYWHARFRPYRMGENVYHLDWNDVLAFRLRRFQ